MTHTLSALKENPYYCRYQIVSHEGLEDKASPFYFQIYFPKPALQIVIFSNRLADSFRSTPDKLQDMANIVAQELKLNPTQVVWIEKCFHLFDKRRPSFNRIFFDWQDGQACNPQWMPILEDWNLAWLENLTVKTIALKTNRVHA